MPISTTELNLTLKEYVKGNFERFLLDDISNEALIADTLCAIKQQFPLREEATDAYTVFFYQNIDIFTGKQAVKPQDSPLISYFARLFLLVHFYEHLEESKDQDLDQHLPENWLLDTYQALEIAFDQLDEQFKFDPEENDKLKTQINQLEAKLEQAGNPISILAFSLLAYMLLRGFLPPFMYQMLSLADVISRDSEIDNFMQTYALPSEAEYNFFIIAWLTGAGYTIYNRHTHAEELRNLKQQAQQGHPAQRLLDNSFSNNGTLESMGQALNRHGLFSDDTQDVKLDEIEEELYEPENNIRKRKS